MMKSQKANNKIQISTNGQIPNKGQNTIINVLTHCSFFCDLTFGIFL